MLILEVFRDCRESRAFFHSALHGHVESQWPIVIQHAHGFWPGSISFPLIGEEVALDVRSANTNKLEQVLESVL